MAAPDSVPYVNLKARNLEIWATLEGGTAVAGSGATLARLLAISSATPANKSSGSNHAGSQDLASGADGCEPLPVCRSPRGFHHKCILVKAVDTRRPPPSLLRRLRARTCCHGRCFHGLLENRRELCSGESTDSVRSCSGRKKAHGRDSALRFCYRKINCATIIYPTRSDISIIISSSIISITFFCSFQQLSCSLW